MTKTIPTNSLHYLKQHYTETGHKGHHFFDPSSMRFFSSRLLGRAYTPQEDKVSFFVTSERDRHQSSPRRYTVRRYDWQKRSIDTEGEFQAYATAAQAHGAARRLALSMMEA